MANTFIKNLAQALYQAQDGKSKTELEKIAHRALGLLRKKRLVSRAPQLFASLEDMRLADEGKIRVVVTSHVALSDTILKEIRDYTRKKFKKEPELHETIDPEILGGFKISVNDTILDATLNTQIKNLSKHLTN